jgi:hypothetical protein
MHWEWRAAAGAAFEFVIHNGAVLPVSAAPVGRGADGVDAMA